MCETSLRGLRIVALIMVLSMSMMAHVSAQTEKSTFAIGLDAGPFLFLATGGHETVGGFGLSAEPHVDYFLTDELAVGATGFFFHTAESDPSQPSIFFGGAYIHVNYHFNSGGTLSPYIGVRIGEFNPNSEMQLALGGQTGLLFFVTRQLSINIQLEVATIAGSTDNVYLSSLGLGLSYYLK